jgi:hypothetical protein
LQPDFLPNDWYGYRGQVRSYEEMVVSSIWNARVFNMLSDRLLCFVKVLCTGTSVESGRNVRLKYSTVDKYG